jgi:hypothetical protein
VVDWLTIYEPGDRFGTISETGHSRLWVVGEDGLARPHVLTAAELRELGESVDEVTGEPWSGGPHGE